jgi:hypothetical protein
VRKRMMLVGILVLVAVSCVGPRTVVQFPGPCQGELPRALVSGGVCVPRISEVHTFSGATNYWSVAGERQRFHLIKGETDVIAFGDFAGAGPGYDSDSLLELYLRASYTLRWYGGEEQLVVAEGDGYILLSPRDRLRPNTYYILEVASEQGSLVFTFSTTERVDWSYDNTTYEWVGS